MCDTIPSLGSQSLLPPAGSWGLLPGRALSLHPRGSGRLTLVQGRAWLTVSAAGQPSTDMVLHVAPLDWRQTVAAPARDLGQAGLVLLDAAGRLAKGLLGLAVWALARPWVASLLARGAARRIPWGLHSG